MSNSSILITNEPEAADSDKVFVRQVLRNFNNQFINDDGFQPLNLFLRRVDGSIAGGLFVGNAIWISGLGWGKKMGAWGAPGWN